MQRFVSIAAIFLVASLSISHAAESQTEVSASEGPESINYALTGRIVNGTKASLRQFPHQISLRRSWSMNHFCGGVVISTNHILSAAHCMFLNGAVIQPWTIVAVGGELQLNRQTSTGQKRGVDAFYMHPQFDASTLHNDVAVLVLKVAFKLTPELNSVPLPMHPPITGKVCQVAGWGYLSENISQTSNDLMYVDLPILGAQKCRELLENVTLLPEGMFCAGYVEGGKDACQGDSGGGMVCGGVLTGIVSGGEGCAAPRFPGVYADVYHYRDWISTYTAVDFAHVKGISGAEQVLTNAITLLSLVFLVRLFATQ